MLMVYAQDDADAAIGTASSTHITIAPAPGGLPYPWQQRDIGAVAKAGTTSYSNGSYTVSGSGADIWGTADEFRFTYHAPSESENVVTARVDSVQNVHAWTKAGVMIRAGLGASAPHASLIVSPGKGIAFQRRLTNGGASVSTQGPLLTAPVWLRLVTQVESPTETVRAYYRKSASDPWTFLGQDTFPAVIWQPLAGLAVSSHADGTLARAAFSNVSVVPFTAWTATSIGASGGTATWTDTQVTLKSIGTDIWGTSDQFEYAYQGCFGDCTITARVSSLQNTHQWAKAGVMIREAQTANAKQVDVIVSPSKGVAMQHRSATGGISASVGTSSGAAPGWVRLTRRGDVFTGSWSTDGVTFTPVGTVTVAMNYAVSVGVAATSHNTATATTAVFDHVTVGQP
jgi:regulation of enolase protein 1 (concanavalin A-like superfamily)